MVLMIPKIKERQKAIELRRKGLSYREILKHVPVAKSTLALWLQSVGLSKKQKQRLTQKRIDAALRGAAARHNNRLLLTQKIHNEAFKDIRQISQRELWLMGIMLYWAEGSKEKPERPGSGVKFTNSDPHMIKLFLKWLKEICDIKKEEIGFEIFIHENSKNNIENVVAYWSRVTKFPESYFSKIYFKKHNPKTNRKNIGEQYYGVVQVKIKASSSLNRKIAGWIKAINQYYWGVV